jgi:hypothetical protein
MTILFSDSSGCFESKATTDDRARDKRCSGVILIRDHVRIIRLTAVWSLASNWCFVLNSITAICIVLTEEPEMRTYGNEINVQALVASAILA